ncbi:MAG: amidase family protein [Pseudomonadota bacterium]
MTDPTLLDRPARAVLAELVANRLTPLDLLDAAEARVAARDGAVNALPTLCFDRARDRARALMAAPASERGPLRGLPIAVKDLTDVAGVRTTYGSPIFADHVPERSDALVDRIETRGGVVFAKSNTPEFGAGASTFNEVFGITRNPHDPALSVAGSSGGSAAALAGGMAWLATGSDLGGSLRTPASFCGVVGLRPTPGRVGAAPRANPFDDLSVEGPMARDVGDLGLLLDAMAGAAEADPLGFDTPPGLFAEAALRPKARLRVAVTPDAGITPLDPAVRAAFDAAVARLAAAGVEIDDRPLDYAGAGAAFQTLRAIGFATNMAPLLERHRDRLKPEVVWNIEAGLKLGAEEIAAARRTRVRLLQTTLARLAEVDAILCPAACVPPFAAEMRYPERCDGRGFENYIDWLRIVFVWSLQSVPALALPAGRFPGGAPFGIQAVGRPRGEAALLSVGAALEAALA